MAILFLLAGVLLLLYINYLIAECFYKIAVCKGFDEKKYLWLPFFFGMIGYLLVVALPDHGKKEGK